LIDFWTINVWTTIKFIQKNEFIRLHETGILSAQANQLYSVRQFKREIMAIRINQITCLIRLQNKRSLMFLVKVFKQKMPLNFPAKMVFSEKTVMLKTNSKINKQICLM
jgi:hypothetical protein